MPTFGKHERRARNEKKESERLASRESYVGLAGEKTRANKRAKRASFASAKINSRMMKKLVEEIERALAKGKGLTKNEAMVYSSFRKRAELDLKEQIKSGKAFKSEEVVQVFKILNRIDSERARLLHNTYQLKKLN